MCAGVGSLDLEPTTAGNSDEALERLRARHHDLAVIDVMMPGRSGMWLAGELRRDHPNTAVVIATAYTELVVDAPVADLLIKPCKRERFVLAVDRGASGVSGPGTKSSGTRDSPRTCAPASKAFVQRAARFHDIGKAAMPESLWTKPSPMTPGEIAVMRRSSTYSADTRQLSALSCQLSALKRQLRADS